MPTVSPETSTEQVEARFAASSVRGVAVLQGAKPVGLLMKNRLYFHLGSYYGVSLYHKRPVELVMDASPMIVNADLPLEAVSKIAMSRDESTLYDLIIVVQDGQYVGVVSIMSLLNNITQLQVLCVHNSNPLTGLPGNLVIEEHLRRLLAKDTSFAVLYIDLNNFKAYNDKYGFEKGDKVLLMTAETLSITSIAVAGVTNQYKKFNNYWEIPEVAAELKKVAKQQKGSGFVFDRRKYQD